MSDYEAAQVLKKIEVDPHTNTLVYFEKEVEGYGLVRIQTWGHGLEVWVGGERRALIEPSWEKAIAHIDYERFPR